MSSRFETRDLPLAAYLTHVGLGPPALEGRPNVTFAFEDGERARAAAFEFFNDTVLVPAKGYSISYRALARTLHRHLRGDP